MSFELDVEEREILEFFEQGTLSSPQDVAQEMELSELAAKNTLAEWQQAGVGSKLLKNDDSQTTGELGIKYWVIIESRCLEFVRQHGPCGSDAIVNALEQPLTNMGKTRLQVINDVTRALSDLSGNSPRSHGRKYPGGPPLTRLNGDYSLRDVDQSQPTSTL